MSTNFLYAHAYCGISARDIGTHVSKVCNASTMCVMSDLICVTSSRSFWSSFASSVTAVSWRSTACSILPLPFTSFTGFKSRTLPCCFFLLVLFGVLRIFVHPLWLLQLLDRTCSAARLPIDYWRCADQCCVKRSCLRGCKTDCADALLILPGENGFAQSPRLP